MEGQSASDGEEGSCKEPECRFDLPLVLVKKAVAVTSSVQLS